MHNFLKKSVFCTIKIKISYHTCQRLLILNLFQNYAFSCSNKRKSFQCKMEKPLIDFSINRRVYPSCPFHSNVMHVCGTVGVFQQPWKRAGKVLSSEMFVFCAALKQPNIVQSSFVFSVILKTRYLPKKWTSAHHL